MPGVVGVTYSEVPVHPDLAQYVQLIWTLDVDDPAWFGNAERILPDGIVEAVFHYRAPFAMRYREAPFDCQPASLVVSQTRSFIEIQPVGPGGFVSVRFFPWGASQFLAVPVSAFADRTVTAADLWGREADGLQEQLGAAASTSERSTAIQAFLLRQLRRHRKDSIEALVRTVGSYNGQGRVHTLCRDVGVTQRTLERAFDRTLGYSPKHFLRLRRFLRTCRLLRRSQRPRLADVALQAGYFDQAHCIGDFQSFAGMTPREFVAAEKAVFLDVG
jgi:AraC-like DNA-binding protein